MEGSAGYECVPHISANMHPPGKSGWNGVNERGLGVVGRVEEADV